MTKVFYPEEFKEKVREVYPENEFYHYLLEQNASILGQFLGEKAEKAVADPLYISTLMSENRNEAVKAYVDFQVEKQEIYAQWQGVVNSQYDKGTRTQVKFAIC